MALLGFFPFNHSRYFCLNLSSHKNIISRHVIVHEDVFPYANIQRFQNQSYDFLDQGCISHLISSLTQTSPQNAAHPIDTPNQQHYIPPSLDGCASPLPTKLVLTSTQHQPSSSTSASSPEPSPSPLEPPSPPHSARQPTHPMMIRAQSGVFKSKFQFNLSTTTISTLPKSPKLAYPELECCNA